MLPRLVFKFCKHLTTLLVLLWGIMLALSVSSRDREITGKIGMAALAVGLFTGLLYFLGVGRGQEETSPSRVRAWRFVDHAFEIIIILIILLVLLAIALPSYMG